MRLEKSKLNRVQMAWTVFEEYPACVAGNYLWRRLVHLGFNTKEAARLARGD